MARLRHQRSVICVCCALLLLAQNLIVYIDWRAKSHQRRQASSELDEVDSPNLPSAVNTAYPADLPNHLEHRSPSEKPTRSPLNTASLEPVHSADPFSYHAAPSSSAVETTLTRNTSVGISVSHIPIHFETRNAPSTSARSLALAHANPRALKHLGLMYAIETQAKRRPPMTMPIVTDSPLIQEQEREYYRRRPTKVNPFLYNITTTPRDPCTLGTFVVILVHSFHTYTDRRDAIRRTWGLAAAKGVWARGENIRERVRLVFVLGLQADKRLNDMVSEEARNHGDVAVGDFLDSYRNLTLKSLLDLKLFLQFCPAARYLVKSDDDMFINLPYLIDILNEQNLTRAIMGPYNKGAYTRRSGKWALTMKEFPFFRFPPYESGSAYVITGDLVRDLYETSEYVPSIFVDDVYVTGILGRVLNVTHARQGGFAFATYGAPGVCEIAERRVVTGTRMTPTLLLGTWAALGGDLSNCRLL